MLVLIACEYSGTVRDAFIARGHTAVSCDLLPTSKPGPHIQDDVRNVLSPVFDLMIAFPPCTDLAVCGAQSFYRKRTVQAEALKFVQLLMHAPIKKICIENPVSVISTRIRRPDQIVHPYYFGDAYAKKTCLWLKNLSPLIWFDNNSIFNSGYVEPEYIRYRSKKTKSGYSNYSYLWKLGKGHGLQRSLTPPGIAQAMALQWG
jgi:hypothetical protein